MVSTNVWFAEQEQELLLLYGKVCVRWAGIDLMLVEILDVALRNRIAAHDLVFNSVGAGKQRVEAFNRSIGASYFDQDERKRVLEITKSIGDLIGERNDIVHAPLVTEMSTDGKIIKFDLKKVGRYEGKTRGVIVSDIEDHVTAIGKLLGELEVLTQELDEKYVPAADVEDTGILY